MVTVINNPERFEAVELSDLKQLRRHWPLFIEGLAKLNDLVPDERKISTETYFRVASDTIVDEAGTVFLVKKHGEGKFLFYCIALNNDSKYNGRSLFIYAAYSTKGCQSVTKFALEWITLWAKNKGYKTIFAESPRTKASTFTLFEDRWGFRRRSVLFEKSL